MTRVTCSDIGIRLAALTIGFVANIGSAAPVDAAEAHHTVVSAESVTWNAAPPSLPYGAQAAVLLGSPAKEGPFVIRLKFPDGYVIPPHRHSKDELLTVMGGSFAVAAGANIDPAIRPLSVGSFIHLPAGMPHYATAVGDTIVQINGSGPFDVTYIDPKDDPRSQPSN